MINIKSHLFGILSERLLLFSINSFANELIIEILNYLYEWNLLKDGKIKKNNRCLNEFLKKTINSTNNQLKEFSNKESMKLMFFELDINFENTSSYIEDPESLKKKVYSNCKKILCNNKKLPLLNINFCKKIIKFNDISCLDLTGNQKEQLLKLLNARKH